MYIAVSYRELSTPDALGQYRAPRCALSLNSAPKPNLAQPSLPGSPGRSRDGLPAAGAHSLGGTCVRRAGPWKAPGKRAGQSGAGQAGTGTGTGNGTSPGIGRVRDVTTERPRRAPGAPPPCLRAGSGAVLYAESAPAPAAPAAASRRENTPFPFQLSLALVAGSVRVCDSQDVLRRARSWARWSSWVPFISACSVTNRDRQGEIENSAGRRLHGYTNTRPVRDLCRSRFCISPSQQVEAVPVTSISLAGHSSVPGNAPAPEEQGLCP